MGRTDDDDGKVVVGGQPVRTGHLGLRPNSPTQETVTVPPGESPHPHTWD